MTDHLYRSVSLGSNPTDAAQAAALQAATKRSRRSFIALGLAVLASIGGWRWLLERPVVGGIPRPFRQVLDFNGRLTQIDYQSMRLAPEFTKGNARSPRANGSVGIDDQNFDATTWQLLVQDYGSSGRTQKFTLAELQALPRTEMTTELKCIEGWSVIVNWAGVRFSDFLGHYPLATRSRQPILNPNQPPADAAPYVGLVTPDEAYYVGLEMSSALHPQTLLCYEMNGQPLTQEHGAPLRLVTPLKYGIKHLKRIGIISFADTRPKDYWAERGYDWYAGH